MSRIAHAALVEWLAQNQTVQREGVTSVVTGEFIASAASEKCVRVCGSISNHPPAEPGALKFMSRSKRQESR